MELDDLMLNPENLPPEKISLLVHRVRTLEMQVAASQRREEELAALVAERNAALDHMQGFVNELRLQLALNDIGLSVGGGSGGTSGSRPAVAVSSASEPASPASPPPVAANSEDCALRSGGSSPTTTSTTTAAAAAASADMATSKRNNNSNCNDNVDGTTSSGCNADDAMMEQQIGMLRNHTWSHGQHQQQQKTAMVAAAAAAAHPSSARDSNYDDDSSSTAEDSDNDPACTQLYQDLVGLCVSGEGGHFVGNAGRFGRRGSLGRLHSASAPASHSGTTPPSSAPASASAGHSPISNLNNNNNSQPRHHSFSTPVSTPLRFSSSATGSPMLTGVTPDGTPLPPPPCSFAGANNNNNNNNGSSVTPRRFGASAGTSSGSCGTSPKLGAQQVPAPPSFSANGPVCPRGDKRVVRDFKRYRVEDESNEYS